MRVNVWLFWISQTSECPLETCLYGTGQLFSLLHRAPHIVCFSLLIVARFRSLDTFLPYILIIYILYIYINLSSACQRWRLCVSPPPLVSSRCFHRSRSVLANDLPLCNANDQPSISYKADVRSEETSLLLLHVCQFSLFPSTFVFEDM